jgi:hypothetical protein
MSGRWRKVKGGVPNVLIGAQLVRVRRSIAGCDDLQGFVLAWSPCWTLMADVDDGIYLNGYVAFRTKDVKAVETSGSKGRFKARALSLRGQWPPRLPDPAIAIGCTRELLLSAAKYSLVTLHVEERDPEVAYIGVPQVVGQKSLSLREITPAAKWSKTITRYRYRDLTRVEVGGKYEDALFIVAGPPRVRGKRGG